MNLFSILIQFMNLRIILEDIENVSCEVDGLISSKFV